MRQFFMLLGIACIFIFFGCGQGEKGKQAAQGETKEAVEVVKEKIGEAAEAVKEKAGAAVETVKEQTKEAVEVVKEKTGEIAEASKEKAEATVEKAKEETKEFTETVKEEQVTDGRMEWQRVLCETNMSRDVIKQIQNALQGAGHDPKYIDGVIGWRTTDAIKSYQKEKGLAVGGLTYETIKSLGIQLGG